MDPAPDPVYNGIYRSVVNIAIEKTPERTIRRNGIIVECDPTYAYIVADARAFEGNIAADKITVDFPGEQCIKPLPEHCNITNGLVGIYCCPGDEKFNTDLFKRVEMCNQPLQMSEAVTLNGHEFSHNCAVSVSAEFGTPVINKNGELVGMNCSLSYHLTARNISALVGTIRDIQNTLRNRV
uniref:Uncharacterized protein n=1 Tax=Oryza nivara TaxID=4536 RepID=A0A0E0J6J9_ORYNI